MGTNDKPVDHTDKSEFIQLSDSAPECTLTTPWLAADALNLPRGDAEAGPGSGPGAVRHLVRFRINLTIVAVQPDEPERGLTLPGTEADRLLEAALDLVESLQQFAWAKEMQS